MVAVKQLARESVQGRKEFLVEVLMLTVLSHPNLVSLVGFCAQGDERLLVYEYMPFGSLESHLFGNTSSQNSSDSLSVFGSVHLCNAVNIHVDMYWLFFIMCVLWYSSVCVVNLRTTGTRSRK